jgi:hypothetical protein
MSAFNEMKHIVAEYEETTLGFGRGLFDDWCIYVLGGKYPKFPLDEWYFQVLLDWCKSRAPEDIYDDFVTIYDATTQAVAQSTLDEIRALSNRYPDVNEASVVWTILYMGMIAEENKAGAILKKRIKRLGVYQVLIEGLTPTVAANYSRGQGADYLDKVCYYRGF